MPKCVFHDLPRSSKAENSRSTMERIAAGATRAMLAMLGLSALMFGVTGTSHAQGFTITSTPTFASTNVGSTSAAGNVVVRTTGTTTITGITVPNSANGSPQFSYKSISGCTIGSAAAGGTNCTISVTFSPAFPGVQTAPLVIAYSGGTFQVGLVGTGVAPQAILLPGILSTVVNTAGVTGTEGQGDGGLATAAGLKAPRDISFDYAGNFYIGDIGNGGGTTDTAEIRKVTISSGDISRFAGGGASTYSRTSSGLAATSVGLNYATGALFDAAGNAYIPDFFNSVVARVDAVTGDITAYAGQYGSVGNSGDGGLATSAQLSGPAALAIDPVTGNLFIVDSSNADVREVNAATGDISTVVGVSGSTATCASSTAACGDNGPATAAQLNQPNGIAIDANGNIYISDSQDNRIRLVTKSNGVISAVVGTGAPGYSDGAALSATLHTPFQITLDPAGDLYIADTSNNAVRVYTPATGKIVTIAGNGTACTTLPGSSCGDGGLSNVSSLNGPTGVALDPFGNVYIVESSGNRVRKVTNNPTPLNTFPTEPIGTTSATQSETLLNIGNATLTYTTPVSPNSDALVTTTDPNAATSTSGAFAQTNATTCGPIYATSSTGTTLASGTPCVFVVSFTPNTVAGNYTGTLVETDNSLNNPASTQTVTLAGTGTKLTPTVALGSSGTPSYLGQSVTFTATVTSPNSSAVAPTGTVAFTYTTAAAPATPITITGSPITVTTSVAGVTTAVISTSSLPLGTDSVTAAYNGDGAYNTASSLAFAQVVQQVSGAGDSVSAASPSITAGAADQLTFAIPVVAGVAVPTGTVMFTSGATALGNATWPPTPVPSTCPSGVGSCYLLSPPTAPTNIPAGNPTTVTASYTAGGASGYASPATAPTTTVTVLLADAITVTSPTSPDNVTYTGGTIPITASSTSGQPLTYATSSPACTVSSPGGVVSEVSPGSCVVTVSQPAAGNYAAAIPQTVTINIAGIANNITFPPLADTPAGSPAPVPAAFSTAGGTITYASTTPAVCTVSGGVITDVAPGTCTITANQAATGNYAAAAQQTQSYQVTPLADTITIPGTVPATSIVGSAVPIGATTTSGVTPTYTSTTPTVCSVSPAGVVTTLAIGSCSVTVSQAAAGNYAAAPSQTVVIAVGGQSQAIQNFGVPITATYGGTAPTLAATATSGLTPTYTATGTGCSVTPSGAVTLLAAGSCQITASQAGNTTFAAATPVTETLTVNPEADVITIPGTVPSTGTVGVPVPIGATTTSGVTPTYTSTTPTICSVNPAGVVTTLASGSCSVTVSQPAAGNFAAATPQTVVIAVNGQSQTIQNFGSPITATYGGTPPALAATATSGLTPTYTATGTGCSVTPSGAVTILAAGSCQITASQAGNSTYAAATPVMETLTVGPAADVITIPGTVPSTGTVGVPVPIGATTTSGVTPAYTSTTPAVCSVSASGVVTPLTSGSCSVTVFQPAAGNYAAATPQTVSITVSGQAQTIQNFGTPITATYGGTAPALAATATSGLAPTYGATGTACSVTSAGAVTILAAGTCQITASQAGNSTYAAATPVTETLTVNPAADVITIPPTVPSTATVGIPTPINATTTSGVTPTYTSTTPAVCSVSATGIVTSLTSGTCTVSVTQPAAGNYAAATPQTVTLTVSGAAQSIQNFGPPISTTFGSPAPVLAATATSGLAPTYTATGSACSVSSAGAVTVLAVGSCQITAAQAGDATYAAATPVTETLTVNPAADIITIPPTVPSSTTLGTNVPIGATTTSGLPPTYVSTTPAVCSVSATGIITPIAIGGCSVTVTQPAAGNYAAATPQTVNVLIAGATNSISFPALPNTSFTSVPPVPAATATSGQPVTYSSSTPACSVTASGVVSFNSIGTCSITANQAATGNYAAATPVTQSFVITPGVDAILVPPTVPASGAPGATIPLAATSTSGGPITYVSNTPATCTVTSPGGVVTVLTTGVCSITLTQPAAGNFAAAAPQTITLNAYDFTIAANSPTSQTVEPGSVVVYTYALAPLGGKYPGANVVYTVTGLPPGATYTLTPTSGSVTQTAGSQTLTLTITTAQAVAMNHLRETVPWTLALLLPFFLRRKLRRRLAQSLTLLLLLGAAALTVTGCAAPNGFFGQPIANYTITVTATSGGVTHSAVPVNLQVQ